MTSLAFGIDLRRTHDRAADRLLTYADTPATAGDLIEQLYAVHISRPSASASDSADTVRELVLVVDDDDEDQVAGLDLNAFSRLETLRLRGRGVRVVDWKTWTDETDELPTLEDLLQRVVVWLYQAQQPEDALLEDSVLIRAAGNRRCRIVPVHPTHGRPVVTIEIDRLEYKERTCGPVGGLAPDEQQRAQEILKPAECGYTHSPSAESPIAARFVLENAASESLAEAVDRLRRTRARFTDDDTHFGRLRKTLHDGLAQAVLP